MAQPSRVPTRLWLHLLKATVTYAIPILAMALSAWTYVDTRKKLERENAMRVYREVSSLLDSACRIGMDLFISFDRNEPPSVRSSLWDEFTSLNALFRNNRTRLMQELGLYFGPELSGDVIKLADILLEVDRGHGARSMLQLREESEASKMYEQSLVWTDEGWHGVSEQNFIYPSGALRWKLLRAVGGSEARALEQVELKRIEAQAGRWNEQLPSERVQE